MKKNSSTISRLTAHISAGRANALTVDRVLQNGLGIGGRSGGGKGKALDGVRTTNSQLNATGIKFGNPTGSKTTSPKTSEEWTGLLKQVASGGVASALGGGGLADFSGFGSLITGLSRLFGGGQGKASIPPMVRFQLPVSQELSAYVDSTNTLGVRSSGESTKASGTGIYGTGQVADPSSAYQSEQIVQAVKQALLTSSTLNDVIAEI